MERFDASQLLQRKPLNGIQSESDWGCQNFHFILSLFFQLRPLHFFYEFIFCHSLMEIFDLEIEIGKRVHADEISSLDVT